MKKTNLSAKGRKRGRICIIVLCLLLLLSFLIVYAADWYVSTYGSLGFDAVLYTLFSGLKMAESGLILSFLKNAALPALIVSAAVSGILFLSSQKQLVLVLFNRIRLRIFPFRRRVAVSISLILSFVLLLRAGIICELPKYIKATFTQSTMFEDEYVFPTSQNVTFPENKRNLIYIFLESMETTFFSKEEGGALDNNVIPELYDLAENHINFSQDDGVGGGAVITGTNWTVGAMVAQTSALPLKLTMLGENDYSGYAEFLPRAITLGDILHDNGYYEALMVGSDANFGDRQKFYEEHGCDKVYDYYTAIEDGIIDEGYYVWWGMEDRYLIRYAQQELLKMAEQDQPFVFTMLTADTHHIGGYHCPNCDDTFEEPYENVYACQSRQIAEFVAWIMEQDFYENTVIVLSGDHPSMDADYMARNICEDYDRRVYNCLINPAVETDYSKNRVFTTMDMMPTTLAAMGCTIEGERLGLGTNLFSGKSTLAEKYGIDTLNTELSCYSPYYMSHFAYSKKE